MLALELKRDTALVLTDNKSGSIVTILMGKDNSDVTKIRPILIDAPDHVIITREKRKPMPLYKKVKL